MSYAPLQEFSVEYIYFFTGCSLVNAMAAQGYSLVAQRTPGARMGTER